jgi:dTDP-glucose pyrophosphorylase
MKIRKAVIPAAGYGTRFLPATKSQPKKCFRLLTNQRFNTLLRKQQKPGLRRFSSSPILKKLRLKTILIVVGSWNTFWCARETR